MKFLANYNDWASTPDRKKRNLYGGVGYYRIVKPTSFLDDYVLKGKEIQNYGDTLENQWETIFKEFDVYWTCYFSNDRGGAAIFYNRDISGKKVILDCDDNYLNIPESNPHYDKFKKGRGHKAYISTNLSFADIITVSTEPLKNRLAQHFEAVHRLEKNIQIVPNMNDLKDWDYKNAKNKRLTLGYAGSNSHFEDLKMALPAIVKVMTKHKNIDFKIMGIVAKDDIAKYFDGIPQNVRDRIYLVGATTCFQEFPEWLASQGFDIGIAPLVDTPFTRAKSHIKWMEYSALKIPTIASRVYPYFMPIKGKKVITHNETGMLAKQNDWEYMLDDLIVNEKKRKLIGENAYNFVKENWQYNKSVIAPILENL